MRVGICLLISGWVSVASAATPGESALAFAKAVQSGSMRMEPGEHWALSPATESEKTEEIGRRFERIREEIKGSQLELGPVKVEGELAGVLIRSTNVIDLARLRVIPIAMVRTNGGWLTAPVPSSFENTPVSALRKYRDGIRNLEIWMAREAALERERLEVIAQQNVRKVLAEIVPPGDLRSENIDQLCHRFLKACHENDIHAIMALSGGLGETLPDDWIERSNSVRMAVSRSEEAHGCWPLLVDPQNFLLPVMTQEISPRNYEVHLVCLIPQNRDDTAFECIQLEVRQDKDGLWVIGEPRFEMSRLKRATMLELFPPSLRLRYPPQSTESAIELKDKIMSALRESVPDTWASLIHLEGEPEAQRRACSLASSKWANVNDEKRPVLPVELELKTEDSTAFLAIQWLAMSNLSFSPDVIHLSKTETGWLWNPVPSEEAIAAASEWAKNQRNEWRENYQSLTIKGCSKADLGMDAPGEDESARAVRTWIKSLADSDWTTALGSCAKLETPNTAKLLLRNLSADCKHIIRSESGIVVSSQFRGKHVTLVGTRQAQDPAPADLYVTVVSTAEGPRVLQEIDLGNPERRGRAFLNRESIERLHEVHPEAAKELARLVDQMAGIDKE